MHIGAGQRIYQAVPGFENELAAEITNHAIPITELPSCWLAEPGHQHAAWAAQTWYEPQIAGIDSISDAAAILRQHTAWWGLHAGPQFRRSSLIADKLPKRKARALPFPTTKPLPGLGHFCLLDRQRLLFAARTQRPFTNGAFEFIEDRQRPPSRAYRKIWEALLLLGRWPETGERCLDCGAAPGAWTWALAELGASVQSIDKAELEPRIAALPHVTHRIGSAFALEPADMDVDWFFSDVICYPERLVKLVDRWLAHGRCQRFVITLKFQGETDMQAVAAFKNFPDSLLLHLHHNKHELTWIRYPGLNANLLRGWPWLPAETE